MKRARTILQGMEQDSFQEDLAALARDGLLRSLRPLPATGGKFVVDGRAFLNFSSTDHLNLANDERLRSAARRAIDEYGCGATASRLMSGHLDLHERLEARLARMTGQEAALVFGSGFLTNLGVITALAGRGDAIFEDRLNHASLIDGARLSGARLYRYQHNDVDHLERLLGAHEHHGRRLIVSDSVFSMDGDAARLRDLEEAARRHGCLLAIDEAHAIGVFGKWGGGVCRETGREIRPDAVVGTMSKALGGYGGFAACSARLRDCLVNRARSFIYSTGLPPACVASALAAAEIVEREPELGGRLLERATWFRERLAEAGFDVGASRSQIVPVMIGDNERTLRFSEALQNEGVLAVAVRPPTVPAGRARLRLSVTLAHEAQDLSIAADALARIARGEGVLSKVACGDFLRQSI